MDSVGPDFVDVGCSIILSVTVVVLTFCCRDVSDVLVLFSLSFTAVVVVSVDSLVVVGFAFLPFITTKIMKGSKLIHWST